MQGHKCHGSGGSEQDWTIIDVLEARHKKRTHDMFILMQEQECDMQLLFKIGVPVLLHTSDWQLVNCLLSNVGHVPVY